MMRKNEKPMGTILIVDDSVISINMVTAALSKENYNIQAATNGTDAIKRALSTKPDAILLDILMPDMDGYETCQILKNEETTKDIPILFMSALTDSFDKVKGFQSGAVDYIAKPIDIEELKARVKTHVTLYRTQKELKKINESLEQKVKERVNELKKKEEVYKTLVDNSLQGLIIMQHGKIMFANSEISKISGYTKDEILNFSPEEVISIVHSDHRRKIIEKTNKIYSGDKYSHNTELRFIKKNGEIIWIDTYSSLIEYQGQPAIQSVLIDITERKNQIKELEDSKIFIQTVLDNLPIGIALNKFNDGHATYMNKKFTEIYGWPEEELIDVKSFFEKVYPDESYREKLAKRIMTDINSGDHDRMHWENVIVTQKNGDIRNVNAVNIPLIEQNTMVSTAIDVTETKKIAKALKDSETRFRFFMNNFPGAAFIKNHENTVLYCNNLFAAMVNSTPEQIINTNVEENLPEKLKEQYERENREVLHEEKLIKAESHFFDGKQNTYWLTYKFPIITEREKNLGSISIEITDQKKIEQELKESQERFELAAHATNDGIYDWNLETNEIYYSPGWKKMLGYKEHELKNEYKIWEDLTHPDDIKLMKQTLNEHLKGKRDRFEIELKMKHKNGYWVDILSRANAVFDKDKKPIRVVGTHVDICERKRQEKIQATRLSLIDYSTNHSVNELLQKFLDETEKLTESDIGFYHFLEKDQETLTLQAWSTNTLKNMCKAEGKGMHYNVSDAGVWIDCIKEKKPVIHNDYASLKHKKGMPEGHTKVTRELAVPVFREKKIVAILGVGNKNIDYNDKDVETVQQLADMSWEIVMRKQTEEALKENEKRLRKIVENMPVMMDAFDENGNIIVWNRECERVTGYSPDEILQNPKSTEILYPDASYRFQMESELQEIGLNFRNKEYTLTAKDGSKKTINWSNISEEYPISGWYNWAIGTDITERKETEKKLRESENRFKNLADLAFEGILIHKNGIVQDINRATEKMVGYKKDELIGKNGIQMCVPQKYHKSLFEMIKSDSNTPYEIEMVRKDGTTFPVEMTSKFISREDGIRVAAIRDITVQKQMQQKILHAIIQTEEEERKRIAQELHDGLGPALSTVKLYTETYLNTDNEKFKNRIKKNLLAVIEEALNQVSSISNNLSPHILKDFGLKIAIQKFIERIEKVSQIKIDYSYSFNGNLNSDTEITMYRVTIELINNTVKHANASKIKLNIENADGKIRIIYRDNGTGFNFEESKKAKTGMGLFNIVNRIESLNGEVNFKRPGNKGIEYRVIIPL